MENISLTDKKKLTVISKMKDELISHLDIERFELVIETWEKEISI